MKRKIELTDIWETFATELNTPKKMKEFIDGVNKAYNMTQDPLQRQYELLPIKSINTSKKKKVLLCLYLLIFMMRENLVSVPDKIFSITIMTMVLNI
ncbi:MAG: hypothetical protein LBQ04_01690 [Endomicrobium sp.]|jgi:hypothetical protein|nr:hypothetical protein [Endomicrobium sp.]